MKICLDFFSGSHGHFLEYVINTWIFNRPRVQKNIFNRLGASHNIRTDLNYMINRAITAKHYTEFNIDHDVPDKVIRITISENYANWIYQINVVERAGDIPAEKKLKEIPDTIKNTPHALRNNWYSKFNVRENGYAYPDNWRWQEIPSFDFPMESLFDITEFYSTLYKLSSFLNMTFVPDQELGQIFEKFLLKNQGWQSYSKCKNIVHESLMGNNIEFTSTICEQALINSMLTQTVGIFDGELFDCDAYPNTTVQIWNQIDHHIKTFDQRF